MTKDQKFAIRCAHADLVGALQAKQQGDMHVHDWRAHSMTIGEMYTLFRDQCDLEPANVEYEEK